jgi:RNA polymerase sigma-70 factor (ECF subfamily)
MGDQQLRLIERMRGGDADAGRQLVREHYAAVYRLLASLTRDMHRAEDLCQETFATAWRKLETFDGRSSFGTWLHRIAYRRFLDWRRGAGRREDATNSATSVDAIDGADPFADVVIDEQTRLLHAAIAKLDEPFREVLVLHYLHSMLHREVAEMTDTPVGTVRWRTREALERLRRLLPDEMSDEARRTEKPHPPAARVAAAAGGDPDPAGA